MDDGSPEEVAERRTAGRRPTDALKMSSPHCRTAESAVLSSRGVIRADAIRRRRACAGCGKRFTTYERVTADTGMATALLALAQRLLAQASVRVYQPEAWTLFHQVVEAALGGQASTANLARPTAVQDQADTGTRNEAQNGCWS